MDIYNLTKVDTTMDGKRACSFRASTSSARTVGHSLPSRSRLRRRPKQRRKQCCLLSERQS